MAAITHEAVRVAALRADEVYDRVRADIVHGVLRPNQRLVEVELAERLGVSRTPVREALYPPGDEALELVPDVQVELNERFHDGVIAAAGNARLAQLSKASRQYYFNHRIARLYDSDETRRSIDGHRRILAALAQGDGPAAEARAREHVDYALAVVLAKVT